jgi:hypothetical protein
MKAESTSVILNNGEPEPLSGTAASGPTSRIICLKPAPAPGNTLPAIDVATALLADHNLTVPPEIVPGLIHANTKTVLGSDSKARKSWVLIDLAVSVATGTRFLKWPTTSGRVLFINFEIHRAFSKERLQRLKERKNLANLDNLDIWNLRGQGADPETLMHEITSRIEHENYSIIVFDPIYKLMVGRSENSAKGVGLLCHQIERLMDRTGAAVVYGHHFAKGNAAKKKSIDRMSGSGVFARDADTIITLTEHQEKDCFAVEMTFRNFPPQLPFVIQWNYPVMMERSDLDPADLKGEEGEKAQDDVTPLLKLLNQKPLTTGEWKKAAEAEGYTHASFFRKLRELRAANRVQKDRKARTWSSAGARPDSTANGATPDTSETDDTFDTIDTSATAETGIPSGHEVSGIKSITSIKHHA